MQNSVIYQTEPLQYNNISNNQQIIEFRLSDEQAEVIISRLPKHYSLRQGNQRREQRVLKKVSRYDATFAEAQTPRQHKPSTITKSTNRHGQSQFEELQSQPIQLTDEMKKIHSILSLVQKHPLYNKLQQVMGPQIRIIEGKIFSSNQMRYSVTAFWSDMVTMFSECSTGNNISAIEQLEEYFNQNFKKLETLQVKNTSNKDSENVLKKQQLQQQQQQQQQKKPQQKQFIQASKLDTPMTTKEKKILGQNIRDLSPEHLRGVWEIVQQGINVPQGEELEFDIDTLPARIARKLEKYVNSKLQQKNKKARIDPPVMPIQEQQQTYQQRQQFQETMQKVYTSQAINDQIEAQEDIEEDQNDTGQTSFITDSG